jgi:ribose-phosphate pyrophosphokinase
VAIRDDRLRVFALAASREFGERVAARLGVALAAHEEREFEDGEHKSRALVNVRGRDAFVIQSLYGEGPQSVDDRLLRLLFFIGCLKDAGAARVSAVVPYLCYARKDRRTQPRDPVTTRYVAALFEAVGVDGVVGFDVHNPAAFENAFRCRTDHLEARPLFVRHFAASLAGRELVVVSPDAGGTKRAERLRTSLVAALGRPVGNAFVEKYRAKGVVTGEALVGDIAGKTALVVDDLVSTGGTLLRAARACLARGASEVHAAATHGLFVGEAPRLLSDNALARIVVCDTVAIAPARRASFGGKLTVLDASGLVAEAIRRIHDDGSIVDLLADEPRQPTGPPTGRGQPPQQSRE